MLEWLFGRHEKKVFKEKRTFVRSDEVEKVILEQRTFYRVPCEVGFKFVVCDASMLAGDALACDLSQAGLQFVTKTPPKQNALVAMKIDPSEINASLDFPSLVRDNNDEILGRVVRVEGYSDGTFSVGVAFLVK